MRMKFVLRREYFTESTLVQNMAPHVLYFMESWFNHDGIRDSNPVPYDATDSLIVALQF